MSRQMEQTRFKYFIDTRVTYIHLGFFFWFLSKEKCVTARFVIVENNRNIQSTNGMYSYVDY
jgi:hypothetical protein